MSCLIPSHPYHFLHIFHTLILFCSPHLYAYFINLCHRPYPTERRFRTLHPYHFLHIFHTLILFCSPHLYAYFINLCHRPYPTERRFRTQKRISSSCQRKNRVRYHPGGEEHQVRKPKSRMNNKTGLQPWNQK